MKNTVETMEECQNRLSDWQTNYPKVLSFILEHAEINFDEYSEVVEVGTAWGDGTLYLSNYFKKAEVTTIDMPVPDEDYSIDTKKLQDKLRDKAKSMAFISPPDFSWPTQYDICFIDISTKSHIHISNFDYWIKYKKDSGLLVMVVPKSNERKMQNRKEFENYLKDNNHKYLVKDEFLIFF
jgi:predicted O-methyltransferase YrrM